MPLPGRYQHRTLPAEKAIVKEDLTFRGAMPDKVTNRMAVFLFTDIVNSTATQNQLGTDAYLRLLARHDVLYEEAVVACHKGRIVEKTGDGFLSELPSPSDAVNAALHFQALMRDSDWPGDPLRARCAIHLGELTELTDPETGQMRHGGMAINFAARLMDLGQGGQILLSRAVFDDARRNVRAHPPVGSDTAGKSLLWEAHGRYQFKGAEEAYEVFEVGVEGVSPLTAPPDSAKARRCLDAEEEQTLGWRPATGLQIPRREDWVLVDKIGEGGFGEVWLAQHQRLREPRVFKFCFDTERLRSFRREVTLFRLLRDTLGQREDIAGLHDVQVDKAPFFLESEYYADGNLVAWAERQGGIQRVPLETRLDLLARTARAAAAAHSVGVIHKDIKPSNILMAVKKGCPLPRLADFGIGELADRRHLEKLGITAAGFTGTLMESGMSSRTGTRLYAAPEYLSGSPATVQGDVYALGVMLYQLVIGDLNRPLGPGWERDVSDDFLREDIAAAVDGDPTRRLATASELAERLSHLETRRKERERTVREERSRLQLRRWLRIGSALGVVGLVLLVVLVRAYRLEVRLGTQLSSALTESQQARASSARAWARNESVEAQHDLAEERINTAVARLVHALRLDGSNSLANSQLRRLLAQELPGRIPLRIYPNRLGAGGSLISSRDDNRLVSLGYPELRVIEWSTGELVGMPIKGFNSSLLLLAPNPVSQNGTKLLTWQLGDTPDVTLWNLASSSAPRTTLPFQGSIAAADLAADGRRILIASNNVARIWDAETGKPLGLPMTHEKLITWASFGDDGRLVVTASYDNTVQLWDTATSRPVGSRLRHDDFVNSATVSSDGRLLATYTFTATGQIWDIRTGQKLGSPLGGLSAGLPPTLRFSPDGSRLVMWRRERTVRIWEGATAQPVGEGLVHRGNVTDTTFSRDGRLLVTCSEDGNARVWSLHDGQPIGVSLPHPAKVTKAVFSDNGQFIHTACADGAIRVWPLPKARSDLNVPLEHPVLVSHAKFSPDGNRILTVAGDAAYVWDWQRPKPVSVSLAHGESVPTDASVNGAAFSPDGRRVLTWSRDMTAQLWDVDSGKRVNGPLPNAKPVAMAGFGANGSLIFTLGEYERQVRIWNAATGQPTGVTIQHQSGISMAASSPDGAYLFTSDGTKARLSDPASGERRSPVFNVSGDWGSELFSGDGKRMVVCPAAAWKSWILSVPDGGVISQIPHAPMTTWEFAKLSPDGRRVIGSSGGEMAELWDADAGRRIDSDLMHAGRVSDAAFSPDGKWVATASDDGMVRLWECDTGNQLGEPLEHGSRVASVSFSPDGRWLVTAAWDGHARVWQAPADGRACSEELRQFATQAAGMEIDTNSGLLGRLKEGDGPSLEKLRAVANDRFLKSASPQDAEIIRRCLGM